MRKLESRESRF